LDDSEGVQVVTLSLTGWAWGAAGARVRRNSLSHLMLRNAF
jgi:hypothetical protein